MATFRSRLANKDRIVVTVSVPGGLYERFFSVTADIYGYRSKWAHSCGCLHAEVLKAFPALADAVALHLSDARGEPMHAEANGFYWLAGALGGLGQQHHGGNAYGAPSATRCLQILAEHLRISFAEAEALSVDVLATSLVHGNASARACFALFVDSQRARWGAEAAAVARKYLGA